MSVLAFRNRDREAINPIPPAIGALGTFAFAPVMLWNLYIREPETFWMVLVIAALVVGAELLYFERETLESEIEQLESAVDPADSGK